MMQAQAVAAATMPVAASDVERVVVRVLPGNRVDRENAARALGRSVKTLAQWKSLGIGPRAIRSGGRVFYDWSEVQAFASGEA